MGGLHRRSPQIITKPRHREAAQMVVNASFLDTQTAPKDRAGTGPLV